MKYLATLHMVQFSFWDMQTFHFAKDGTAIIGANGAGKTSLIDGIQIAMVGAHGQHMNFNAQSVHKDSRLLRDYALGAMRSNDNPDDKSTTIVARKREEALSYITMVFRGERANETVSAGVCIHSTINDKNHKVLGLFVLPGVDLTLEDHLEVVGTAGARAPVDWDQFEALIRSRAKAAGLTPTITTKPEHYMEELLHSIQDPGSSINRDQFMRSFKHSINLKQVESVDAFLRKYLVESNEINKRGTLAHIKTMRQIGEKIESVKVQIGRLDSIEGRFATVRNLHQQRASARIVRLTLNKENAESEINSIDVLIENLQQSIIEGEDAVVRLIKEDEGNKAEIESLIAQRASDPELLKGQQAEEIRRIKAQALNDANMAITRLELGVRSAFSGAIPLLEVLNEEVHEASEVMRKLDNLATNGPIADQQLLERALKILESLLKTLGIYEERARSAVARSKSEVEAEEERLKAATKGVRLGPDDSISQALAVFRSEGIEAQTVSSLVRVLDTDWQGAIESFLARNRFALVVNSGPERDAVRVLRASRLPLYGVTVVQPHHLKDDLNKSYPDRSVASLIDGDNPIALAYLQRLMGGLRQVASEEELELHPRSMTKDGMLSSNGGTSRLRLVEPSQWVFGVKISQDEVRSIEDSIKHKRQNLFNEEQTQKKVKTAMAGVQGVLSSLKIEDYLSAITVRNAHEQQLAAVALPVSGSNRLQEINNAILVAQGKSQAASGNLLEKSQALGANRTHIETKKQELAKAQAYLLRVESDIVLAQNDPDHDPELSAKLYEDCENRSKQEGPFASLEFLNIKISNADRRIESETSSALAEFVTYINEQAVTVIEERSNWRTAYNWISAQKNLLETSTLVAYKDEADRAKAAAEQAFKNDVKFKIREAITRVRDGIKSLNEILKKCPEFSGGERYKFTCYVNNDHKELVKLIESDSDDFQGSLLDNNDEGKNKLVELLEACETGENKGNNPLEDYRLLFNFDLEILSNDVAVDQLSKRMGKGSNGEHRVPFYVIAGASLAAAYRIKDASLHRGAGVMLIDEAFYAMDAPNTEAAAEFLRSLGLQLIMAAPDTDIGKLIPVIDSYYDVFRPEKGPDAFADFIQVKEPAKKLLQSDIPELNPALIQRQIDLYQEQRNESRRA